MTSRSKAFLEEFIEMFKNEPALWQAGSKIYRNKAERLKSLNKLVAKYREVRKDANIDIVKAKINTLRGTYIRELHKIRNSRLSGAGPEEIYKPTIWYFDSLAFLRCYVDIPTDFCLNEDDSGDSQVEDVQADPYANEDDSGDSQVENTRADPLYLTHNDDSEDAQEINSHQEENPPSTTKIASISREFLEELIELFKHEPALWKSDSKIYKNKAEKLKSWKKLLAKYKEVEEDATIDVVKRKINTLRTCYRRELKKIKKSRLPGAGAEDIYKPTLWYFDSLSFLERYMDIKTGFNEEVSGDSQVEDTQAGRLYSTHHDDSEDMEEIYAHQEERQHSKSKKRKWEDINSHRKPVENSRTSFTPKPQKRSKMDFQENVEFNSRNLNSTSSRDEADVFGEGWILMYRKLDAQQKIYAKLLIDEALLQGQLGRLMYSSCVLLKRQRRTHNISANTGDILDAEDISQQEALESDLNMYESENSELC